MYAQNQNASRHPINQTNKQENAAMRSRVVNSKFTDVSINLYVQGNKAMYAFLALKRWSPAKLSSQRRLLLLHSADEVLELEQVDVQGLQASVVLARLPVEAAVPAQQGQEADP